jgi:hypothetical protein
VHALQRSLHRLEPEWQRAPETHSASPLRERTPRPEAKRTQATETQVLRRDTMGIGAGSVEIVKRGLAGQIKNLGFG